MSRRPWTMFLVLLVGFFALMGVGTWMTFRSWFGDAPVHMAKNSILHLELNGIILDGKKFLKQLNKYREDKSVKAIVIEINSPGGVVGPSQEIYEEIKRVREDLKKPIVAVSTGLMASGAYYAAVAADKIVVAPGAMVGSIGVIMEFTNLEKLYDWAKISRYSITTGKFKDSGAEYRAMRDDEKALFKDLINDVYLQFVDAVSEGRDLKPEFVKQYADGRVVTGRQAAELGLVDEVGTLSDAYDVAADLAGLGDNYEVFDPPKAHPSILEFLRSEDDDFTSKSSLAEKVLGKTNASLNQALHAVLRIELSNRPLLLMPGGHE